MYTYTWNSPSIPRNNHFFVTFSPGAKGLTSYNWYIELPFKISITMPLAYHVHISSVFKHPYLDFNMHIGDKLISISQENGSARIIRN